MKISIISSTYNSSQTIITCVNSIFKQSYINIEHLIIDGASIDNTINIINSIPNRVSKIISEPDNGLYDAINKGIKIATGDYIGILNSDDFFKSEDTIEHVAKYLNKYQPDCLFGDVEIVDQHDLTKIKRKYSAKNFTPSLFKYGIMPPHPSVYIKRELFDKFGLYKLNYKIAADFELLVRFLWKEKITYKYMPETIVTMRDGGMSNQGFFKSKRLITKEVLKACNENGLYTNKFMLNLRYLLKLKQLLP
jgi:glycosyltransferase involved in cell wall biosynthesis